MKRADLKVGETYAVLAPSQKPGGGRYSSDRAKKVTVVDTAPVWDQSYRGWRSEDKPTTVILEGTTYEVEDDQTWKHEGDADVKRLVKVIVHDERGWGQDRRPYLTLQAVPLSQVRMTWAEYETARDEANAEADRIFDARQRAYEAREKAQKAAAANAKALNEVLEGTDLKARILDGEVVLAGPLEVLKAIIETANDQSFRKAV